MDDWDREIERLDRREDESDPPKWVSLSVIGIAVLLFWLSAC